MDASKYPGLCHHLGLTVSGFTYIPSFDFSTKTVWPARWKALYKLSTYYSNNIGQVPSICQIGSLLTANPVIPVLIHVGFDSKTEDFIGSS